MDILNDMKAYIAITFKSDSTFYFILSNSSKNFSF